jgi:hypothetical protein
MSHLTSQILEGIPMAKQTIAFNSVSEVARNEKAIAGLKGDRKAISDAVNTKKVESYTSLIVDLAVSGVQLVARGKQAGLPKAVTSQLKAELLEAGVSDACVKRYVENTNGLVRAVPELLNVSDFGQAALVLDREGCTTEAKIKSRAFGTPDPLEALAKKIAALDEADRTKLDELVRAFVVAKHAEEQAKAQAEANADSITATLEALEAVA